MRAREINKFSQLCSINDFRNRRINFAQCAQVIRQALLNRRGLKNSGAVFRLLLFRYCHRHVYVLELN